MTKMHKKDCLISFNLLKLIRVCLGIVTQPTLKQRSMLQNKEEEKWET